MDRRLVTALVLGWAGIALLFPAARFYRIDVFDCPNWPPLARGLPYQGLIVLGVLALTASWVVATRAPARGLAGVMLGGVALHGAALLVPCFTSQDPLFYAAIGRAIARAGADPYSAPIGSLLAPDDPIRGALPAHWFQGTSAYSPGFHLLAASLSALAGDSVGWHLKLFQIAGALSMLATALLVAHATGDARAAAFILFSPLAVVEGTIGGHNDGLLAVAAAAAALALRRGRRGLGIAAALAGLLVKASALLLGGVQILALAFGAVPRRRGVAAALTIGGLALALAGALPYLRRLTLILQDPTAPLDHCNAFAIECALRIALRHGAHAPAAAWATGVVFRVAGAVLVVGLAWRAAADRRVLSHGAAALFFYYLFFHATPQPWYSLSLLPLIPFADSRHRRAMLVACTIPVALEAVSLRVVCHAEQHLANAERLTYWALQMVGTIVPPSLLCLHDRRRRPPAMA